MCKIYVTTHKYNNNSWQNWFLTKDGSTFISELDYGGSAVGCVNNGVIDVVPLAWPRISISMTASMSRHRAGSTSKWKC